MISLAKQQNVKKIFIVGCPRSGTTLLQQMLDAHPDIAIAPETHFMRHFWERRDDYGDLNQDVNYRHLLEDITAIPEFTEMGLSTPDFLEVSWNRERSYANLFNLILEHFAEQRGVEVVGEKTPNHLLYMSEIKQFFPSACFIHIIRDPRAVVNSWRSVPWSNGSITGDAKVWQRYMSRGINFDEPVKSSVFTLFYEELILAPEKNLRSLCDFLGLTFVPAMLTYNQRKLQLVNVMREPWKAEAVKPISQKALDRWQRELSRQEICEIEAVTFSEMKYWGYEVQTGLLKLLFERSIQSILSILRYIARKVKK